MSLGVELGPHLSCPAEAYHRTKWHLDPSSRLATTKWAENWGLFPLFGGGAESPFSTMWPGLRPTSMPSDILVHPAVWPQHTCAENWGCSPFLAGELGPHVAQCGLGRGLPPYQVTYLDPSSRLTTIDMGRNWGRLCPLLGRGNWVPI